VTDGPAAVCAEVASRPIQNVASLWR
jgi:hypothetical protein